jgi:uncharacterized glyoxalase superfamily protein PhnB
MIAVLVKCFMHFAVAECRSQEFKDFDFCFGDFAMNYNRSVPPDTLLPHVCYRNVEDALAWLSKAFGFVEHYRYGEPGGRVNGAQVHLGNAWIMLRTVDSRGQTPAQLGCGTQSLTVFVDEVEAHYKRAKSAGARIVEEPHETAYGEFQYAAHDLDGHHWLFSRHATDHAPEEWGAVVAKHATRVGCLRRPRLCYIEIPARDAHSSAVFYEKVFGWSIRHRESDRPSFDDATGDISGAFVTGRAASREPGLLPYIWVDNIDATLRLCATNGATIVESRHPDHPGSTCDIATFRDPAGNLIGLYEERES